MVLYVCECGAGQLTAGSRIRLEWQNTSFSSITNYLFFETASNPRSDIEEGNRTQLKKSDRNIFKVFVGRIIDLFN